MVTKFARLEFELFTKPSKSDLLRVYQNYILDIANNRAGRRYFRQEQKQQTSPGRKKVNPVIMARVHRLRIDADDKTVIYTHNM